MYFFDQLSNEKKNVYNLMLQAIDRMQSTVYFSAYKLTEKELDSMHYMILNDNPKIFWLDNRYSYSIIKGTGMVYSYSPKYRFGMEVRKTMEREILEKEKIFLSGIRFSMTAYEKALRLYENFPRLIKYDDDATVGIRKAKRRYNLDDCSTIYGAFVRRKAVCEGYAKAYQYLLNKFSVKCTTITGDVIGRGSHAWNLVYLDHAWYHVDVTWGDQIKSFVEGKIDYSWFGLSDRDILRSRSIDQDLKYPSCNRTECNYFVKNHAYFLSWNPGSLENCVKRMIRLNQYKRIQLRFSSADNMKAAWNYLTTDNRIFKMYRAEGIEAPTMWHTMSEDLNVLTFWTEFKLKRRS